jgi:excisionase family DNA binding protein
MALEHYELIKRQKGQEAAAELAEFLSKHYGDEPLESAQETSIRLSPAQIIDSWRKLPPKEQLLVIRQMGSEFQPDSGYLTVSQVAERIKRTPHRVRQLLNEGVFPKVRQGKVWLIPEEAIEEYTPPGTGKKEKSPKPYN